MFIFSLCQMGAESVFKREVAQLFPGIRSAFARPGFVTFKTEAPKTETSLPEDFLNRSVFARTVAASLGKIEINSPDQLALEVWKIAAEHHLFVNRVHVFPRDPVPVDSMPVNSIPTGEQERKQPISSELIQIHRQIIEQSPQKRFLGIGAGDIFQPAQPGETVLDVVRIEPHLFFIGTHSITDPAPIHARYSGGILPIVMPADAVSRAYLKFKEGILWSGIVPGSGDRWLDIGASPGGCSQFLLQQGVRVFGVDPGAIHSSVLSHPQFTHIRCRIKDIKRSLLREIQWITADMNVAPNYTLDVLDEIVAETSLRGLLFTLKLIRWELADNLQMLLDRIRSWGFSDVRMKHLFFNRQEVMVVAK